MCKTKKEKKVAKIYEQHFAGYINWEGRKLSLSDKVYKAVNKCMACRTKKLGVVTLACEGCGITYTITRGCNHRFCSYCGASSTMKWGESTLRRILNIRHFHVVFTLPKHLRFLSKLNGNKLHDLLFKVSASIVKDWFSKRFKILPGIISVLHTSGSDLKYHPHVHMVVSCGGKLQEKEEAYKELQRNYLEDNEVFGGQLKERFIRGLIKEYKKGELKVWKEIKDLSSFEKRIDRKRKHWIVNIEKPLSDIHEIVGYVGRYTKRACISEYKILEVGERIKIRYNDYKNSKRHEKPLESIKEFTPYEFLEALLQHVPEARYRMVRYYGLYNSRYLKKLPAEYKLKEEEVKKELVESSAEFEWGEFEEYRKSYIAAGLGDPLWCEDCGRSLIIFKVEYEDDS